MSMQPITALALRLATALVAFWIAIAGAAAQSPLPNSDDVAKSREDIMRMGQDELRSLVNVLVECSMQRMRPMDTACLSPLEKYQIEYRDGRPIDRVLQEWHLAIVVALGGQIAISYDKRESADRRVSLEDVRKVIAQAGSGASGTLGQSANELEQKLKAWASESFKQKRVR